MPCRSTLAGPSTTTTRGPRAPRAPPTSSRRARSRPASVRRTFKDGMRRRLAAMSGHLGRLVRAKRRGGDHLQFASFLAHSPRARVRRGRASRPCATVALVVCVAFSCFVSLRACAQVAGTDRGRPVASRGALRFLRAQACGGGRVCGAAAFGGGGRVSRFRSVAICRVSSSVVFCRATNRNHATGARPLCQLRNTVITRIS